MRILVILSRFPYPLEKGDKLRAYNHIKYLSKNNEIILVAINAAKPDKISIEALKPFCKKIEVITLSKFRVALNLFQSFFSGLPFQVGYFYFNKAQKIIDNIIEEEKPNRIFCQLIRTTEYVKNRQDIPLTLDYMDIFSKGMERRTESDPFYMRPVLKMELARLKKYEKEIFDHFKNKVIISTQDRELIPHPDKDQIAVIPNGVDLDFFKPLERKKEFDLIFNGNMQYPPNIDSVEFLVHKIMPLVWKKHTGIKLLISGAAPSKRVIRLASKNVIVSGWVEDIRENFAKSKILVAPMKLSIGLQNKLLEAMAMKIPCITSTLANNALSAKPEVEILIADTTEEYAKKIFQLLEHPQKANDLAENAYQFVLNNFDWAKTTKKLEEIIIS